MYFRSVLANSLFARGAKCGIYFCEFPQSNEQLLNMTTTNEVHITAYTEVYYEPGKLHREYEKQNSCFFIKSLLVGRNRQYISTAERSVETV